MKNRIFRPLLIVLTLGAAASAFAVWRAPKAAPVARIHSALQSADAEPIVEIEVEPEIERVKITDPIVAKIVAAAHAQEGDIYNASYQQIPYPNGDVPRGGGACTDVLIRAFRAAGYDLQKLIHEDMKRNFRRYPNSWGLKGTDKNIDHRRVPNQMTFFQKFGQTLPKETTGAALKTWKPGDVVVWKMDDGRWHTGLISDGIGESGTPLVIHNAMECFEQDYLTRWKIMAHYRFPKK